jgi:eukaryotic-like serine/threonine-protein kinase
VDSAIKSSTGQLAHNYVLKQRYRIIGVIGRGGFGAVYKARDTRDANRLVAVKEMHKGGLSPQQIAEVIDTFTSEVFILSGLTHPNLPHIYDHFVDDGRLYIVMDFIEGETLEELLLKAPGGYFRVERVLEIGIRLCGVLDYLHSQLPPVIFRDLKPANIMLTPDGSLYLIDFGVARHFKLGKVRDTIPFGSPGYAAPEQYGSAQTTPRSDIYSLGVTLYQMLTGLDPAQTPFQFAPLQLPDQAMPAGLDLLIMQMLEIDEGKRPAGVSIVERELQRIAIQQGNSLQPTTFPTQQSGAIQHVGAGLAPALPHPAATLSPGVAHPGPAPPIPSHVTPARGFIFSTCRGHTGVIRAVAWSPDGQNIASASDDATARVWNAATGRRIFSYLNHDSEVLAVAWSPDGQHIASGGWDHTVQVWDAVHNASGIASMLRWLKSLASFVVGIGGFIYRSHTGQVYTVAWSPDGQDIASAGNDHTVQVWQALTGRNITTYGGHTNLVWSLAWSPDGKHIASGGSDHSLRIWNVHTGRKVFINRDHSNVVLAVAWSPDGKHIVAGNSDARVRVWEVSSGSHLLTYHGHVDAVQAVAWSPDGRHIASGSCDTAVHVWQALTGQDAFTYHGHADVVYSVAWSPDGQRLASAGSDRTIQVWQAV